MFEWDAANELHIARHGISRAEIEEVFAGRPLEYDVETRNGELRPSFLGATAAGRVLFVVVTERGGGVRVVTAFPARTGMKRLYAEYVTGRAE